MTPDFFERQIDRLRPLGEASDEFKDAYWDALRDIPPDVFDAAITQALRTRTWFPKPAELRADADLVARQVRPVPATEDRSVPLETPFTIDVPQAGRVFPVTRVWKYYCDVCEDSGWTSKWCGDRFVHEEGKPPREIAKPWVSSQACDRHKPHLPHEWAHKCVCYDTNTALVRKREAATKYAEKPGRAT